MNTISALYDSLFLRFGFWVDVVLIGLAAVLAFLLFLLAYKFTRRYLASLDPDLPLLLKRYVYKPGVFLFLSIGLLSGHEFLEYEKQISKPIGQVFNILLIIALTNLSIKVITGIKSYVLKKYDLNQDNNLKARKINTQYRVMERLLKVLMVIGAIGFILMTFEDIRKVGISLLASAGVAGIIIGLAAQKSISTIIAGIQIAFTQPIRIQDVVIVEGEWGTIEEITLTYVVVRIWDQRRLVVPITYFISTPFQNWTRNNAELLGTIFIYADYSVDINAMRRVLHESIRDNPLWDGRVAIIQLTETTEKTIQLRILVSSTDSPKLYDLRCEMREAMVKWLQKNHPESLPYNRVAMGQEAVDRADHNSRHTDAPAY